MSKNDRHGVQPVAEIVRDYAESNQKSHLNAGLKADSDRDAVEETVEGQAGCRDRAQLRLMSFRQVRMLARTMHRRVPLESEEREESQRGNRHVRFTVVERKDLRQYVEQGHRQHRAGAEAEQ